jgi:hypothetical protein
MTLNVSGKHRTGSVEPHGLLLYDLHNDSKPLELKA